MKRILILTVAMTVLAACCQKPGTDCQPVDHVSTLVGTMSKHSLSTGNTYPAIARPWGTHFWTPQTGKMYNGWAYVYTDDKIRGFKQTHQPSPWMNDYSQFSLMPVTTGLVWDENARASWFSHKAEKAAPYYYSVYLADHDATVELAPTERAAAFRITYPARDTSYLVLDAFKGSEVSIEGNRITGYVTNNSGGVSPDWKNWFVVESDTPFEYSNAINEDHSYAVVGFRTSEGQQVNLKVASSWISPEQAVFNLEELGDGDIDRIASEGRDVWNEMLGRLEVRDNDIDHLRTFYSCLYRSLLFPHDLSEITPDGKRVHRSPHDGQVHEGYIFSDTGLWDTFRCQFALLDLVYPDQAAKMMEGFQHHYEESGFLPEWGSPGHRDCMVGNNSASVIAEAYLKGVGGNDPEVMWKALVHGAHDCLERSASGRKGYSYYDSLGFIPCNIGLNESAARTLEYAYDDWCILQMGQALGKSEEETAGYSKAALNYRNLYRSDAGLMGGRCLDGTFPEEFSPFKWGGDFTEGNAFHYTWSVFHDLKGLADLMGGEEKFEQALDNIFEVPPIFDDSYYGGTIHEIREMQIMNMGNYAHGNQPIQHVLYLYDWCKAPWKTQARVREVMEKFYTAAPDGYCGDEDNGQTSAWYIFSALGFYPVCPASCEYALGTPLFKEVTIHYPSGKDTRISAPDNSRENFYVSNVRIGGKSISRNFIRHEELKAGRNLSFRMSGTPDKTRGTGAGDAPYSFSSERQ